MILTNYKNSWKINSTLVLTFLLDLFTFHVIFFIIYFFGQLLTAKAYAISNGQTAEQLKAAILTSPESAQATLASLQSFILISVIGMILIILVSYLLFTYSRSLIWNKLVYHKFNVKNLKGWIGLNVVLTFVLLFYLLIYGLLKLLIDSILYLISNQTLIAILSGTINTVFLFLFVVFAYLCYYSLTKKNKVFSSLKDALHLLRKKETKLRFTLMIITFLIINLIFSLIKMKWLIYQPDWVIIEIEMIILIVLLAWSRYYLVQGLRE